MRFVSHEQRQCCLSDTGQVASETCEELDGFVSCFLKDGVFTALFRRNPQRKSSLVLSEPQTAAIQVLQKRRLAVMPRSYIVAFRRHARSAIHHGRRNDWVCLQLMSLNRISIE